MSTRAIRWSTLAGGASLAVIAAHLVVQHTAESRVDRLLAKLAPGGAVTREAVSVDPWSGRVSITGLAWGDAAAKVTVGSVEFPGALALVTPAVAADAVTLSDIAIDASGSKVMMKRIEVAGTAATRDDIAALFDSSAATPIAERLARLSAERVTIPDVTVTKTLGQVSSSATYRDVRLTGIEKGVIKSMAASGGAFDMTGEKGRTKGTIGAMAGSDIDTVLIARVYTEKAGPNDKDLKLAYGSFTADAVTGNSEKGGGFTVGRMAIKNVRARPTSEAWIPFFSEFAEKGDVAKLPPSERARFVNGLADVMESFSIELIEAADITATAPPDDKDKAVVKIARMAYSGAAVGKPNDMRLEGLDVTATNGYGRIGSISQTGWSFKATLDALRSTLGDPGNDGTDLDPRMFIPDIGTFAIRDVDLNVPDEKAATKSGPAPNIRVGLKTFEIATADPLQGVPTAIRVTLDRVTMAIPPGTKEEGLRDLLAMGYKDLDLSFGMDSRWTEASSDLNIGQLAVQGVNMGSLAIKGVLGNVTRDVFTGDSATAQVALLGATVKTVGFTLENKGLAEKLLEREARKQKKTAEQLRKELGSAAAIGIPAMLGGSPNAKMLGNAVAKFLAKPGKLTVAAKSRDPGGLGFADFAMAQGDPASLLDQLDITATAE